MIEVLENRVRRTWPAQYATLGELKGDVSLSWIQPLVEVWCGVLRDADYEPSGRVFWQSIAIDGTGSPQWYETELEADVETYFAHGAGWDRETNRLYLAATEAGIDSYVEAYLCDVPIEDFGFSERREYVYIPFEAPKLSEQEGEDDVER